MGSEGTPHRGAHGFTISRPPPGMGIQGVALRWYAVSRWDKPSPQRGGAYQPWATPWVWERPGYG